MTPPPDRPVSAPIASVDSAWLRMDEPTNQMVVTGILIFETPVAFSDIRRILDEKLLRFPRFSQRVADGDAAVGTPTWETDPEFSLDRHIEQVTLPPPADAAALQAFVGGLMNRPFEHVRPLWRAWFVPDYLGGSALVMRVHHAIGDGLALIYVLLTMADPPAGAAVAPGPTNGDLDEQEGFWAAVGAAMNGAANLVWRLPASAVRQVGQLLTRPSRLVSAGATFGAGVGALGRLVAMESDPDTVLRGPLGTEKRVVWSEPIPVATLKRIGRVTGATLNDVLMAIVSGAVRRYLLTRGPVPETMNVRGVIPVNLRPLEESHRLGNEFGLVFLSLPIGIDEPLDRLFEVRRRMVALKQSPEAYVVFQLLRAIGAAPRQIFDLAVNVFSRKATAVVTNVIGPRERIRFAGRELRQVMFFVPSAGRLGLGVSVISYAGSVWLGLQADTGLLPDPSHLLDACHAELAALDALERQTHAPTPADGRPHVVPSS
ncbi:MAG: wax ester/triacylglycerol synthase family O-acyltransferase [Vicinamibacteraceae bacterium]|nr:wax ester/triacylglycerol synthase family O-acyltransferase [Vicinamibacteraceae bacterium]